MKTTTKKVSKKTAVKKTVKKTVKSAAKTEIKKAPKRAPVSIKVTGVMTKKVAAKKITGATIKKEMVVASNYNSFWLNDGQILNTLKALEGVLKNMDNAVYKYHTNNGRHDFANWVEDVLKDIDCAAALKKAKTPKSAHAVVVKHLAFYK
jgi:hypothetical protein